MKSLLESKFGVCGLWEFLRRTLLMSQYRLGLELPSPEKNIFGRKSLWVRKSESESKDSRVLLTNPINHQRYKSQTGNVTNFFKLPRSTLNHSDEIKYSKFTKREKSVL